MIYHPSIPSNSYLETPVVMDLVLVHVYLLCCICICTGMLSVWVFSSLNVFPCCQSVWRFFPLSALALYSKLTRLVLLWVLLLCCAAGLLCCAICIASPVVLYCGLLGTFMLCWLSLLPGSTHCVYTVWHLNFEGQNFHELQVICEIEFLTCVVQTCVPTPTVFQRTPRWLDGSVCVFQE